MPNFTEKLTYILGVDDTEFSFQGSVAQIMILEESFSRMTEGIDQAYDEMIGMASELETSMANVSTLLDTDAAGIDRYTDQIIKLSTEVPSSAVELSEGLYQVVSAGIDAGDAMEVLGVASRSAVAGMSDTFTAVDAITTILNAYDMEASEAANVSDVLFTTVKRGKTTFGELSGYIGTFATNAAASNISLIDVNAAMATFTKSGLKTARAATSLDAIMREISKKPELVKMFKQAGYASAEAALETLGLQGSIKLIGDTAEKEGKKFNALWGEEALRGATIINQNFEMAKEDLEAYGDIMGAQMTAYEKAINTLAQTEQQRINAHDALLIKMGNDLLPMHVAYNKVLGAVYANLSKMPESSRVFVSGGMAIIKMMGDAVKTGGEWMRNIASIREGYMVLKPVLNTLKNIGNVTDEVKVKTQGLGEEVDGVSEKMKGAKTGTVDLKNALGAAGLSMAIAFTVTQLIALWKEIGNYNEAVKSLEATNEGLIKQTQALYGDKTQNERLAASVTYVQELIDLEKERPNALVDWQKTAGANTRIYKENVETAKAQLKALGIEIDNNTNLEELLAKAQKAQQVERKKGYDDNAERRANEKEAVKEEIKAQETLADQIREKAKLLKSLGGSYYLKADFDTEDDKALRKRMDDLDKLIGKQREANAKKNAEDLKKITEENAKTMAKIELDELKESTIEKTDWEISELKKQHSRERALNAGNTERLKEIDAEYLAAITSKYELKKVQITNYYNEIRDVNKEAMDTELAQFNGKEEIQEAIREKYRLKGLELDDKTSDAILAIDREQIDAEIALEQEKFDKKEELRQAEIELTKSMGVALGSALATPKKALKDSLMLYLDYIKAKMMATQVEILAKDIASKGFFGFASAGLKFAGIEAAFQLAKGIVAKFNTSGIPQKTGMAIVEPKDVIINPYQQDNPVIQAVGDAVSKAMGNQGRQNIVLNVDGRVLGEVVVDDVRQQNKLLPRGRSVYDESIGGTA